MIMTALIGRLIAVGSGWTLIDGLTAYIGTPMSLDSLGAGAPP